MFTLEDKREIERMIDLKTRGTFDKRIGDTPTDALQLVPKKYVDSATGRPLFDHFVDAGNITTNETDLYSDTLVAGQLRSNGDKLEAEYGGIFVSSGTATRRIRLYFGGSTIFDTGDLTLSLSSAWTAYVTAIRVSASVVRTMVSLTTEGAALSAYTSYTQITGLNLANSQIFKITGQAAGVGAASNDIVAKIGAIYYFPVAI